MSGSRPRGSASLPPAVAIIGCGRIARVHAANLIPRVRPVFVSRRRSSAEAFARRFGGETAGGLAEVADRQDIRGAVVCTPLEHHAAQAAFLVKAGKTVLVEKPMAATRAEVGALGRALGGRPPGSLMVAENYLYKPSLRLLRAWLRRCGPIQRVRLAKKTRQRVSGWRTAHGALIEGGIHFAALLGAIIEETPEVVAASFRGGAPERRAEVTVRYPSGAVGELLYAWDAPSLPGGILQHSRIEGTSGQIVFESNGLYLFQRGGGLIRGRMGPLSDLMGFGAMTRDYLRTLADPRYRPFSDFARAERNLGLIFSAYEAGGRD